MLLDSLLALEIPKEPEKCAFELANIVKGTPLKLSELDKEFGNAENLIDLFYQNIEVAIQEKVSVAKSKKLAELRKLKKQITDDAGWALYQNDERNVGTVREFAEGWSEILSPDEDLTEEALSFLTEIVFGEGSPTKLHGVDEWREKLVKLVGFSDLTLKLTGLHSSEERKTRYPLLSMVGEAIKHMNDNVKFEMVSVETTEKSAQGIGSKRVINRGRGKVIPKSEPVSEIGSTENCENADSTDSVHNINSDISQSIWNTSSIQSPIIGRTDVKSEKSESGNSPLKTEDQSDLIDTTSRLPSGSENGDGQDSGNNFRHKSPSYSYQNHCTRDQPETYCSLTSDPDKQREPTSRTPESNLPNNGLGSKNSMDGNNNSPVSSKSLKESVSNLSIKSRRPRSNYSLELRPDGINFKKEYLKNNDITLVHDKTISIPEITAPMGCALNSKYFFLGNTKGSSVLVFNHDGQYVEKLKPASPFHEPCAIAVLENDHFYVNDGIQVCKFNNKNEYDDEFNSYSLTQRIGDRKAFCLFAFNNGTQDVIATIFGGALQVFGLKGDFVGTYRLEWDRKYVEPNVYPSIKYGTTTPEGDLLLCDLKLQRIWKVYHPATPQQKTIMFCGAGKHGVKENILQQVAGIVCDNWGNAMFLSCRSHTVYLMDHNGVPISDVKVMEKGKLATKCIIRPADMVISKNGLVFINSVTHNSFHIFKIDSL